MSAESAVVHFYGDQNYKLVYFWDRVFLVSLLYTSIYQYYTIKDIVVSLGGTGNWFVRNGCLEVVAMHILLDCLRQQMWKLSVPANVQCSRLPCREQNHFTWESLKQISPQSNKLDPIMTMSG